MQVKLNAAWFAPSDIMVVGPNKTTSGQRYKKGTHTMPDSLRPYLPRTAVVLAEAASPAPTPVKTRLVDTLRDFELERHSVESVEKKLKGT